MCSEIKRKSRGTNPLLGDRVIDVSTGAEFVKSGWARQSWKHTGKALLYDGELLTVQLRWWINTTVAWGVREAQTGVKQWLSGDKALYFDDKTVIIKVHISK